MKTHYLIFIVLTFCALVSCKHNCVHDKIREKFKPAMEHLSEEERQHRLLQYTSTQPIKIFVETSTLTTANATQYDLIANKLVPIATEFLRKRLNVLTKGSSIRMGSSTCFQVKVPTSHMTIGVDADLVIYVTAANEPAETYLAWATACSLDSVTMRPNFGQIQFNLAYLSFAPKDIEPQVDTTLHEITHILGFSGSLYQYYTKSFKDHSLLGLANVFQENVRLRGGLRQVIKSSKVLEVAKKYFNCSTIPGIEIENEGGGGSAGSHWERTILHNEQMTASDIPDASYSEFTLALLQDSGWYQVNFTNAEPMYFGKGAGCSFINNGCDNGVLTGRREWCLGTTEPLCTFNYRLKAYCSAESFSDNCKYAMGYSSGDCEDPAYNSTSNIYGENYALGSKCIVSSIISKNYVLGASRARCYKYTCGTGTVTINLSGGGNLICSKAGQVVIPPSTSKYYGNITCPDPASFCSNFYPQCPNSCSLKGYCVMGKCECRAGWTGVDCSIAG